MMLLYPANFAIATSNCHFNPRNGHDQEPLPLSVLSPRYSINNPMLSKNINAEKGIINWYWTKEQRSPYARKFSDILGFEQGIGGQRKVIFHVEITYYWHKEDLAVHSLCSDINIGSTLSFTVPPDVKVRSSYTVYWMWNTTEIADHEWLLYS